MSTRTIPQRDAQAESSARAIPLEDLAEAVLRALRQSKAETTEGPPDVDAPPRPAAALVVHRRRHLEPELKPILVTDFYRKAT